MTGWECAALGAVILFLATAVAGTRRARVETTYRPVGRSLLDLARPRGRWHSQRPGGPVVHVRRVSMDPELWDVSAHDLTPEQAAALAGQWWTT